jgi:hypothetical protein
LAVLAGASSAAFAAGQPNDARWTLAGRYTAMWVAFAVAILLLRRAAGRTGAVGLVIAGGIVLQAVALSAPPRSTDDYYRYAWDGTVQAAGVDPYRYAPTDPALAALRTDWLFPPDCRRVVAPCTVINHPRYRTIYPPVAQAEFLAVHLLAPAGARDRPWQLAAALLALLTTLTLIRVLRRAGRDPCWAALWAWCPTVVIETGNAAHVDVLGVLLATAGLAAAASARGPVRRATRRAVLGGVLLGAAVGVKLLPALVFPAVLRRRGPVVIGTAAATLALAYLPHLLAVGPAVLGYLPGYLREEGYDGTGRFPVIRLLGVPYAAAPYLAAALLIAVAVAVARRTNPDQPWDGAVVMTGAGFLITGPSYPWYALLLVGLVALSGRWEWLPVAAAAYPPYLVGALHLPPEPTKMAAYGTAAALTILFGLLRTRTANPTTTAGHTDTDRATIRSAAAAGQ